MKTLMLAALGAMALAPALASAGYDIFSPDDGVLCDKVAGFCADEQGISMGLTRENLGPAAEQKLMAKMSGPNVDASEYTLSDGTHCISKRRVCTKSKTDSTVSAQYSPVLFGSAATAGAGAASKPTGTAKPSAAITFPERGVICDRISGFCVDDQGISAAMTKMYLGAAAETKIVKLMSENPDMDTATYVLSNGVDCRSQQRVCMAERHGNAVEPRYTRQLFGN
jgi:hypothetical protein